jgi:hypothetical protein
LALDRQAASPAREAPAQSPRPSSPEDSAPPLPVALETAAPGTPGKDSPPAVAYGRLLANGALLLILGFEGGVLLLSQSAFMSSLVATMALFATVVALVQTIFNFVFQFVSEEFKQRARTLLQSSRLTRILSVVALLGAVPSVLAARQILWPPPLLQILPAPGLVFNSFPQAKGEGDSYFLEVKQDGKFLGKLDVTGAGSIEVGQDPQSQVESLDGKLKDAQKEEMDKKTGDQEIKNKWTDPGARKFLRVPLRSGCVQLDLTDPADTSQPLISRQWVRIDSNFRLTFLEDKIESQGCGS